VKGKVYFIGAGPGDPELITLKGRRLLDEADVIVFAGSLVNGELLKGTKAALFDSAKMTLEETHSVLMKYAAEGKTAVRLHSGDTSFYSAITEQINLLKKEGIEVEVVPGVSSLGAGAAALGQELTIPEIAQSVIVTRMQGRTPVPPLETIVSFASHKSTMVIFLSVGLIEKLAAELIKGGYEGDTPVAVIERASWPDQKIIKGDLSDIAPKVREAGIKKTALIFIGKALAASESDLKTASKLYDKDFSHGERP
jgi:precorrin-4/cobalt-precorrin-4 C11-methyltransferase